MERGDAERTWGEIRDTFRGEIGEASYQSWIGVLTLDTVEHDIVHLAAPNRFICERVSGRFGPRLQELWQSRTPGVRSIGFVVRSCEGVASAPIAVPANDQPVAAPRLSLSADDSEAQTSHVPTSFTLDKRYRFDSFVVGQSNELANAAARRVAESDSPAAAFNPLFLYGGVGLGKTHLMHAIACEALERNPDRRVLYLTAEKFMHRFVSALRYKDTFAFKDEFRSVDLLLIDDFQFIAGKASTQEEFFHTFNALIDGNRQIVISADRSPNDLEDVEERIKSRLNWGLVADIGPTDYELRLGILQSKIEEAAAANPGLTVEPKVLEFVAHRVSANARVLEGALNRLVAHATLVGRPITLDMAHETLGDLVRAFDRRLTIDEIQRKVAEHYNIRLSDMLSPRRARAIARPRQIAMFLCKELTNKSLPDIGRKFGGRDHTTIMHGIKRIAQLSDEDASLREDVAVLRRSLEY
jgi:chromosomal replication initiator protein